MSDILKFRPKRRVSYQMGFGTTPDDQVMGIKVQTMPSRFRGTKLFWKSDIAPLLLTINGKPVEDHKGQPLDEAFFQQWAVGDGNWGANDEGMFVLDLSRNYIYVTLQVGDKVELKIKRGNGPAFAMLVGYVEVP